MSYDKKCPRFVDPVHGWVKTFIGFALSVSGQRLFIPYLGHLLWSLLSMKRIIIGSEKVSAFPQRC